MNSAESSSPQIQLLYTATLDLFFLNNGGVHASLRVPELTHGVLVALHQHQVPDNFVHQGLDIWEESSSIFCLYWDFNSILSWSIPSFIDC